MPWNDWNGDGVVDWQDTAIESTMVQFQLDEMEREERNMHMVEILREYGEPMFDYFDFCVFCSENGYSTSDFTQEDFYEIQSKLMQI